MSHSRFMPGLRAGLSLVFLAATAAQAATPQPPHREQDSLMRRLAVLPAQDTERVNTLNELAWVYIHTGQFAPGQQTLVESRRLARQLHFAKGEIKALNYAGVGYTDAGDYKLAKPMLEQAVTLARQTHNANQLQRTLYNMARLANYADDYEGGRRALLEVLQLRRAAHDKSGTALALQALSNTYANRGDYPRALALLLEAETLAEQLHDVQGMANTLASIGNIYNYQDNARRALDYYARALPLFRQIKDEQGEAACLDNMGVMHNNLGNSAAALPLQRQAAGIMERLGLKAATCQLLINVGTTLEKMHRLPEALAYYQRGLQLAHTIGDKNTEASALYYIAETESTLGHWAQAQQYATRSFALAHSIKAVREEQEASTLLAAAYKRAANYPQALHFTELAATLRDSLYNKEKSEELGRLQGDFQLSQQRLQVAALAKDRVIQAQRLRQQQVVLISLGLGLLAVLVVGLLLWRLNKLLARKNQEIEQQRATLEQLNRTKDRLFSIIGHDLRGPLNSLHAFVSMLHLKQLPQEKLVQYGQRLNQTLDQTLALIDNLLSWAAIQMQASERVHPESMSLPEAVNENFRLLRTAAENKQLHLTHSLDGTEQVWADPDMVRLVLRNLLSNAIKFTPQGGRIHVGTAPAEDAWHLTISDSGVGLDAETQQRLLNPAETVRSTAGTAQESGTGLGLILCRDFVTRNGGRLWVESAGPGLGTTFHFTLPRAAALSIVA